VDTGALLVALTAGMVAAFNPCGFAMLPAYLGLFLGDEAGAKSGSAVGRALGVGAAVTVGFVAVFGVAGMGAAPVRARVLARLPGPSSRPSTLWTSGPVARFHCSRCRPSIVPC
jgi:hypothetical protein